MLRPALLFFSTFVLVVSIGCGNSEPTQPEGPPSKPGPPPGAPASGNQVFDTKCLHCHAYSKDIPGPPRSGPSLATVSSKHKPDWIMEHIKDPKTHTPGSKMPEFGTKLNADELKSVTDFLAGLK